MSVSPGEDSILRPIKVGHTQSIEVIL